MSARRSRGRRKARNRRSRPDGKYRINTIRLPDGRYSASAIRSSDGRCVAVSNRRRKLDAIKAVRETCAALVAADQQKGKAEEEFYRIYRRHRPPQVIVPCYMLDV